MAAACICPPSSTRGWQTACEARKKTLFVSGIVVMLGHIALATLPGLMGLFIGLSLIALGSGGVKPTVSTMVGSLYESEERRPLRDAGFSIFYISVNIGSFFGPLLTGLLQENIGFHFGFGTAAVGMALGLSIYASKRAALSHTPPNPLPDSQKKTRLPLRWQAWLRWWALLLRVC